MSEFNPIQTSFLFCKLLLSRRIAPPHPELSFAVSDLFLQGESIAFGNGESEREK